MLFSNGCKMERCAPLVVLFLLVDVSCSTEGEDYTAILVKIVRR